MYWIIEYAKSLLKVALNKKIKPWNHIMNTKIEQLPFYYKTVTHL